MSNSNDMRFIIQDYLSRIKERDELDAILPDLLRAMGFEIVKLAFRGEVEHGVDIAAIKGEQDGLVLYLIQVKPGDIDQRNWDSGRNSIRATLHNLLDVPFQDLSQPKLKQAKKLVILVHNGTLRENVRVRFNGFLENEFSPRMSFDRWDLDKLAKDFHLYLLNERILPNKEHQRLLKRTLIFLDVPDYNLIDFKLFLRAVLPDTGNLSKQNRDKVFGLIRLVLAIIVQQCQQPGFNNLTPALTAHEEALLTIWGWMYKRKAFNKKVLKQFSITFLRYLYVLNAWIERVVPVINMPAGLSLNAAYEPVEYPLRTFQVIGNLGLLSCFWLSLPDNATVQQNLRYCIGLIALTIKNNRSSYRPLLDNHSIDIFLGMYSLLLTNHKELAKEWLKGLFEHLAIRKRFFGRLPELYNNLELVIEYEATDERPIGYTDSSSTLIYMLFELCVLLNTEDLYIAYKPLFEGIDFQVWYPPNNVEEILYFQEVHSGLTETIQQLPNDFSEFRKHVTARYQTFDKFDYSPNQYGYGTILLLAHKHFRTPVFTAWWRKLMVAWGVIDGGPQDM